MNDNYLLTGTEIVIDGKYVWIDEDGNIIVMDNQDAKLG